MYLTQLSGKDLSVFLVALENGTCAFSFPCFTSYCLVYLLTLLHICLDIVSVLKMLKFSVSSVFFHHGHKRTVVL